MNKYCQIGSATSSGSLPTIITTGAQRLKYYTTDLGLIPVENNNKFFCGTVSNESATISKIYATPNLDF